MPVSATIRAQRSRSRGSATTLIEPVSVNFRAFPTRFARICVSRAGSVVTTSSPGATRVSSFRPFFSAAPEKSVST